MAGRAKERERIGAKRYTVRRSNGRTGTLVAAARKSQIIGVRSTEYGVIAGTFGLLGL